MSPIALAKFDEISILTVIWKLLQTIVPTGISIALDVSSLSQGAERTSLPELHKVYEV